MNDLGWQIRIGLNDYVTNQNKTIYECDVCGVKYTNLKSFDKHIMWREFYDNDEYCN